jgi:peptidoglycan/LPS O-acetylase OafA/YrhL
LAHTWSLATEEHFYLVWPLVLVLLPGRTRTRVAVVAALGAVVCFLIMQVCFEPLSGSPTSAVYYRPDARSAALLLGCCLAALPRFRVAPWLMALSLTVLAAVLATAPEANVRAAYLVTMPLVWVSTAVLVAGAHLDSPVTRFLSRRPIVYVGMISYGLYLYHAPVAEGLLHLGLRRMFHAPLAIVVTLLVAAASYRWLERPFLALKQRYAAPVRVVGSEVV